MGQIGVSTRANQDLVAEVTVSPVQGTAATDPLLVPNNTSNSGNGRNTASAHVVNMPSEPSDDETCKLPNWKHYCEVVYKGMTDKLCSCVCIPMRKCCRNRYCSCCQSYCRREPNEGEIRRRLKLHFMSPVEKLRSKLKGKWLHIFFFALKLMFQLLIVSLVTAQITTFGQKRTALPKFIVSNKETIKTLFLDFGSKDAMMVYSMDGLYHQIQRIADTYYNIQTIAVAPYAYTEYGNASHPPGPPLLLATVVQFDKWKFDTATHDIYLSRNTHSIKLALYDGKNETCYHPHNCTIQSQLEPYVNASSIGSIKSLSLHFELTNFFIDEEEAEYISCVTFDITITFDNAAMSGAIPVELKAEPHIFDCNSMQKDQEFFDQVSSRFVLLDGFVIGISTLYLVLCILSIIGNCILTCDAYEFFQGHHHETPLTLRQLMSLQNFWFNGIIIGTNFLVIVGTVLKIQLTYKSVFSLGFEYMMTIILGLGLFFQWCGLLLYFNLFESFNLFLLTLRISFPSAIKFIMCAAVLYVAFMFLGWIVLGPYHPKFADLSITSDCLYSLINGDDIYKTYKDMPHVQTIDGVWIFSKIYLYLFIALFIYVVLNVFIGLIFDTYQKLKENRESHSKPSLYEFALGGMATWRVKVVETDDDSILYSLVRNRDEGGEGNSGTISHRASVNQSPGDSQQ